MRMVLASARNSTLQELADLVDKVAKVAAPSIAAVGGSEVTSELERLRSEVASLRSILKSLPSTTTKTSKSRGRSREHGGHDRPHSPHPTTEESLCWYHCKHGAQHNFCKHNFCFVLCIYSVLYFVFVSLLLFSYWVLDKPHTELNLDEDDILPSNEDYTTILASFAVLAGPVIQKYLPALKDIPDLVRQHISLSHHMEMRQQSQVVFF